MGRVTIRPAVPEDYPFLTERMEAAGGEVIALGEAPCWVAEQDGRIVGFLPLRAVWQMEPLIVLSGQKITKSRAALLLYRAAEVWIADRNNGSGVHWYFTITRSPAVKAWAKRLGWFRQYKGAALYIKKP